MSGIGFLGITSCLNVFFPFESGAFGSLECFEKSLLFVYTFGYSSHSLWREGFGGGGVLGFGIGIFLLFGVCSERRIAKSFQVRFSLFWHIYAHTSKSISLHKRSNILQRTLANHSPPDPGPALYMPRYFSFCQTHMHGFPLLHQIG